MSLLLKKNVSSLSKKDIEKELNKIEEFEQDIECTIWQCTYTDPVMVEPCLHLYCDACIKSWSTKINECPKCKETIKGYSKQPDMEAFLEFYQKLCEQEKTKLKKIKELVLEREEMLTKINSILDQNVEPPKRPQTAQIKKCDPIPTSPFDKVIVGTSKPSTAKSEIKFKEEMDFKWKICLLRDFKMPIFEYTINELTPANLEGNQTKQNTLITFWSENGSTIDQIFKCILEQLETLDATTIYPHCKTKKISMFDSAWDEWLFEFSDACLKYYVSNYIWS